MRNFQWHDITVHSGDEIKITGYSTTCKRILTNYEGMVDSICCNEGDGLDVFKTWPNDDYEKSERNQLTDNEKYEGKIWFDINQITSLTIVRKNED